MEQLLEYLENELDVVKNPEISTFLKYLSQGNQKDHLLLWCIAIDIKHRLLNAADYILIIKKFSLNADYTGDGLLVQFHHFILSLPQFNLFSEKFIDYNNKQQNDDIQYVRVVRDTTFNNYIGKKSRSMPALDNSGYEIDREAFRLGKKEWSGRKSIIWITPYKNFKDILRLGNNSSQQASIVCDFLGWPHSKDNENGAAPAGGNRYKIIAIIYPPQGLPCRIYQPNTTNAAWCDNDILYLSHTSLKCFGKTYNDFDVPFGMERIHQALPFWHEEFDVTEIGEPETVSPNKDEILTEAKIRFYYE